MCILRPPQYNAALVFGGLYLRYLHVVRYWYNDYKLWMYMDGGAALLRWKRTQMLWRTTLISSRRGIERFELCRSSWGPLTMGAG